MAILGEPIVRLEDPSLLTGTGTFIDDLALERLAFVTYARRPVAHARITAIDTSEARAPARRHRRCSPRPTSTSDPSRSTSPCSLDDAPPVPRRDVVRFVGEPIVAIVTEERYQGEDAAELVIVDYDPLPVVIEPDIALDGEVLLFPEAGTNVCFQIPAEGVIVRRVRGRRRGPDHNQKVAPCPIEGRVAARRWERTAGSTHWQARQGAHPVRDRLAAGVRHRRPTRCG